MVSKVLLEEGFGGCLGCGGCWVEAGSVLLPVAFLGGWGGRVLYKVSSKLSTMLATTE